MSSQEFAVSSASVGCTEAEVAELLRLGRGAALPHGRLAQVHELVVQIAHTRPHDLAVRSGSVELTYRALLEWADAVAAALAAEGVARGGHVGVLAEPSAAMVAAVLGILRSGSAYVPVEPTLPDRRIAEVLADAGVVAVVVAGGVAARELRLGLPVVDADSARLEAGRRGVGSMPVADNDVAYIIYTSGSTGEPKGVVVEHGQLAASNSARLQVYPGNPVFLLVSPLAFDSSAAGLWSTLTTGGRLVVATEDELREPERLVTLIEREQVTRTLCIPSFYGVLLDAAERLGVESVRSLETVIVAGEPLPEPLVDRHFAVFPVGVPLFNECGATETSVWATVHRFDAPGTVSIGGPIPGANLYVLDDAVGLVPRGVEGELAVGGAVVARGYLGRPEATARAFLDDPFAGARGARLYRTGDTVRWNDAGTLEYVGRRDQQVKIRGHRVELGAVEVALRTVSCIHDAAVVVDSARTRLTAFVVAPPETDIESVRRHLAERLPAVMVPARIDVVEDLPLTFSGKVDRRSLQALADAAPDASVSLAMAVDGSVAARVAAAWVDVLDVPHVAADVNFFDLGGHSLTMFQLQDALERRTGVRPSVVDLFRYPSVSAQVALIESAGPNPADQVMESSPGAARRARLARVRLHRAHEAEA